jgi:AcrR family transcriptional regulator
MSATGDQRKQQILRAAADCFARKGFHLTTIDDICRAAEVSPGSVYRYFRSKDDIIRGLVEEEHAESAALIAHLGQQTDLIAALTATLDPQLCTLADPAQLALHAEVSAEVLRNPAIAAVVRASEIGMLEALTQVVRNAQATGQVDASIDPARMAELLFAIGDGLWRRQIINPTADPNRHTDILKTLIHRLFQPQPPAEGR